MSYVDGEELILRQVRLCDNFNASNTARCNWKILNSGKASLGNYAVLRPGSIEFDWVTPTVYDARWVTVIEVWQRYKDDIESPTRLYARINDLITGLMVQKRLGDTTDSIIDFSLRSAGEVEEMRNRRGGLEYLRWSLSCAWAERTEVTFA